MPKRKGKSLTLGQVVLICFLVVGATVGLLFLAGVFSATGQQQTLDEEGNVVPLQTCSSETTPDLLIKARDVYNKNSAITESFIYRIEGSDNIWSDGTTGTELTDLIAYEDYEFVFGVNSTNGIDKAYGAKLSYKVQCKADDEITVDMYNDELEGSLSATFYNNDDNAAAETFIAGQTQDVRIKFQAGTDEVFGNPNIVMPNVLILKLNSSEWDKPEKVYLEDGTELKSIGTPQRFDDESLSTTGYAEYAYEAPVITDVALNIFLKLNADDTNAPSVDGTAYLYAGDYFVTDENAIGEGIEDEEGADIATSDSDSVTLDFTV